jgi:hypothetical protein
MLASADAGQLEEWQQYAIREPFGDDWHQSTASLVHFINMLKVTLTDAFGGSVKDDDILPSDSFVPGRKKPQKVMEAADAQDMFLKLKALAGR